MVVLLNLAYIAAAILFIYGLKMLGRPETARQGNRVSAVGMLVAVVATLINQQLLVNWWWVLLGLAIGTAVGGIAAQRVQMTGMPELVALFNGSGGLASLLVGWAEYLRLGQGESGLGWFTAIVIPLAIIIGAITATGSVYAWGKLSGKMNGQPWLFEGQRPLNLGLLAALVVLPLLFLLVAETATAVWLLLLITLLALALGVLGVMPIGGGDMPVVVSLLNSFSGLAASAAGFVIQNNVLVVAGCLVGASGFILTMIMCKAMNRTLTHVLLGGFGATAEGGQQAEGEMKAASLDDAYHVLEAAQHVLFVPGYGMAVAQAQHVVKELGTLLEQNGADVRYVVHPVAGRMPGHMNVLLAEADVPYEQLVEMEDVNPNIGQVDVAIVIGANDVVNPAALTDPASPIYGMPIINVHEAQTVYVLKRGAGKGFSGIENHLFFKPNTRMIYGDAKATLTNLLAQFKEK